MDLKTCTFPFTWIKEWLTLPPMFHVNHDVQEWEKGEGEAGRDHDVGDGPEVLVDGDPASVLLSGTEDNSDYTWIWNDFKIVSSFFIGMYVYFESLQTIFWPNWIVDHIHILIVCSNLILEF